MTRSPEHQAQRRAWTPIVNTGTINCWRCNTRITPNQPWDLGHRTDQTLGGTDHPTNLHPEHRHTIPGTCTGNLSAGATLGNKLRTQPQPARAL